MSSHVIPDSSGDFQHIHQPICHTPDNPDGLDTPRGAQMCEDPDLDIVIYRKNDSQFSLRSASPTQVENIRILRHTGKSPRAQVRGTCTPQGSTHSLGPLPDSLLVYPLLGTGFGTTPGKRGKSPVQSFMDNSHDDDILCDDWTMWLPRPKRAHTHGQNFSVSTSPKKKKPDFPDYIAEITAPLAKEEDFDFMIMPAVYNSQIGAMKNTRQRRNKRRNVRSRFLRAMRKMFNKD